MLPSIPRESHHTQAAYYSGQTTNYTERNDIGAQGMGWNFSSLIGAILSLRVMP